MAAPASTSRPAAATARSCRGARAGARPLHKKRVDERRGDGQKDLQKAGAAPPRAAPEDAPLPLRADRAVAGGPSVPVFSVFPGAARCRGLGFCIKAECSREKPMTKKAYIKPVLRRL